MAVRSHDGQLPREVIACLTNARYLHLATSDGLWPHVSLMNYTYLASSPYPLPPHPGRPGSTGENGPLIILTTQASTKKTLNLTANPRVSLLVHDWVSHRSSSTSLDPTATITNPTMEEERAAQIQNGVSHPSRAEQSSLAALLANLNSAELSSISATLNGYAHIIPHGTEEEEYYKRKHLENNPETENRCYLVGEELRVVVVRICWARVSDYTGGVRDYECLDPGSAEAGGGFGMETGHFARLQVEVLNCVKKAPEADWSFVACEEYLVLLEGQSVEGTFVSHQRSEGQITLGKVHVLGAIAL